MCGIVGIISRNSEIKFNSIIPMLNVLQHRGPDGNGICTINSNLKRIDFHLYKNINNKTLYDNNANIVFGHTRLSIQDLTDNGHQPMSDLSQNIWITFNGEIYNFLELKTELKNKGYNFKSNTDTEVIIYSYLEWGIDCIQKLNGMFAFALYDNIKKELYLVRDRYGIKPLYYHYNQNNGTMIFASEVKAILEYPDYKQDIDKKALYEYFTFQNIFTDKTLYKDIQLLPPGNFVKIDLTQNNAFQIKQYWDFDFSKPLKLKDNREYTEELNRLINQSVSRQLISDVEIGSYLSGGIDSGLITALASKKIPNLKTFTIGFDLSSASGMELTFDERSKAEYMSNLFKTEHYEMILKAGDMERCLPTFAYHLEEPRVGQSYPNYYASKLASKFIKVVLSGAGSDELFAGYPWRYYKATDNTSFDNYIDKYYSFWQRLVPDNEMKNLFKPIWSDVKDINTREIFKNVFKPYSEELTTPEDYINHSLYFEAKTFLHGLLVVEDKLSMAHGLETRLPFLDNDLVDFSQQIPTNLKLKNLKNNYKINENTPGDKTNKYYQKTKDGKLILRNVASKYMSEEITSRIKQGFSSPDASWFKGESIDFVREQLFAHNANTYEYLDKQTIHSLVNEHLSGQENRRLFIWSLLNFQQWSEYYGK